MGTGSEVRSARSFNPWDMSSSLARRRTGRWIVCGRARARRRVDLIVAAVRIQRRSGGGLATQLRGIATTFTDQDRLDAEARAATAQARFTSMVVLLLPVAGMLLAELASPGIVSRMISSAAGLWLLVQPLQCCSSPESS